MSNKLNAVDVLSDVKRLRTISRRRRTWSKSRLAIFSSELVLLRKSGASYGDLQYWLRHYKRVKVHRSTVKRFLDKFCPSQGRN